MVKNGCGPKKEPVEPASELLLPHLLCIHVILKTQLRYSLKKKSILGCICWYFWTNDCDGFSTANAGFQHASTIRLRFLLAMKMLLLTPKKGFESEQKGMRTNTPEGFDLEEKSVGAYK